MTREEAKYAAKVMDAFARGRAIEFREKGTFTWEICSGPICFDWRNFDYRVKKEPTYRPFKDKEECWNEMMRHQPFGWVESTDHTLLLINCVGSQSTGIDSAMRYTFKEALNRYTFADGTPFGIKEE